MTARSLCRTLAASSLGLVLLAGLLGCGADDKPKIDDPAKIEEQMKEYQDMSKKERAG